MTPCGAADFGVSCYGGHPGAHEVVLDHDQNLEPSRAPVLFEVVEFGCHYGHLAIGPLLGVVCLRTKGPRGSGKPPGAFSLSEQRPAPVS